MIHHAAPPIDPSAIERLREAAATCKACHLWENATQTVFGAGRPDARVMLIGEQPGDQEDRIGQPFVGPAGKVLDRALLAAGINRDEVYLTNAVKHFKWKWRGRRRLHVKPTRQEITACHPWLEEEIRVLRPRAIVCLGITAAGALLGRSLKISSARGHPLASDLAPSVFVTVHPSYILRLPQEAQRAAEFDALVNDLRLVHAALAGAETR
jgi:uracil-DNA glycosylase